MRLIVTDCLYFSENGHKKTVAVFEKAAGLTETGPLQSASLKAMLNFAARLLEGLSVD